MRTFVLRDEIASRQLHAFLRANWLACAQQGKPLAVTVSEHKARRSGDQNRLYWAFLRELSGSAWVGGRQFADEAWHEFFKRKFIGLAELPDGALAGISTTALSVAEFGDYVERIRQYATEELGIEI